MAPGEELKWKVQSHQRQGDLGWGEEVELDPEGLQLGMKEVVQARGPYRNTNET